MKDVCERVWDERALGRDIAILAIPMAAQCVQLASYCVCLCYASVAMKCQSAVCILSKLTKSCCELILFCLCCIGAYSSKSRY